MRDLILSLCLLIFLLADSPLIWATKFEETCPGPGASPEPDPDPLGSNHAHHLLLQDGGGPQNGAERSSDFTSALRADNEPDVATSDPLYRPPEAEQVRCDTVLGPDACSTVNCTVIDWLQIYNKSINSVTSPPSGNYSNVESASDCFSRCNSTLPTAPCVAFTFRLEQKECHIFHEVFFESVLDSSEGSTLYIHIAPKVDFLDEWLLTLNKVPRGMPFKTFERSNLVNCTYQCGAAPGGNCLFAVLNRTTGTCGIYSRGELASIYMSSNVISIEHTSLSQKGSSWRFAALGPIFQKEEAPDQYTAFNREACLEDCYNQEGCQLATTTAIEGASTVDCSLYNYYQDIWYQTSPPSQATVSYYLFVQRWNTLYRKWPHFHRVHYDSSTPTLTVSNTSLGSCKQRALASQNCYYFSYNATSRFCRLYGQNVKLALYKSFSKLALSTFQKTMPHKRSYYYYYESYWAFNVSNSEGTETSPFLNGDACLERCAGNGSCAGVAIQRPEGNCTFYNQENLNRTLVEHNETNSEPGVKAVQVFLKRRDLSIIESPKLYRCFPQENVKWSDLNQQLQSHTLEERREEIPEGNNAPLEPHGPNYEGTRNDSIHSPESRRRTYFPKVRNSSAGYGMDMEELRWEKFSEETRQGIHDFLRGTFGKAGGIAGYGVGFLGGAATSKSSAGAFGGGVVGAYVGEKVGEAVGEGVAWLVDLFDSTVCWLDKLFRNGCNGPNKSNPTCAQVCGDGQAAERFYSIIRAIVCTCDQEPDILQDGKSMDAAEKAQRPPFDGPCKGRNVGQTCRVCCRTGYQPQTNPLRCSCPVGFGNPEWYPDKGECKAKDQCRLVDTTYTINGQPENFYRIPVEDCQGVVYYGSVFSGSRKIPFFTMYHFSSRNTVNGAIRRSFKAFPCTDDDIKKKQLTQNDYSPFTGSGAVRGWVVGHTTPHADMRFRLDAAHANSYFINVAPQDKFANLPVWEAIENRLRALFSEPYGNGTAGEIREGYVVTGVCLRGPHPTLGKDIPTCFWKLACTRMDNGTVTVAAFYHQNIKSTSTQQLNDRRNEGYQVRDQSFVANLLGFPNMGQVWSESNGFWTLPPGPFLFAECAAAPQINFPPLRPFPGSRFAGEGDEGGQYALYNFWQSKTFGEGFNQTVSDVQSQEEEVEQNENGAPPSCGKKVVGYVTGWSDVPFTRSAASYLTHAIFAFVQMLPDGKLQVGTADPENSKDVSLDRKKSYLRLHEMRRNKKAARKNFRALFNIFAVGGWANSQYFSRVAASPDLTQNFIRSAIEILNYFDMDGIDIDWEYPVTGGANEGIKQDRENYVTFLKTIRSALDDLGREKGRGVPYTLTIAGAAGSWVLEDGFDLPAIAEIVSWINVMTYDYNGAWESKWGAYTGPHSPLYFGAPSGYSGKTNVDYTMKYYSCRIDDPSKLVMGLGLYGRFWNNSGTPVDPAKPVWRRAPANGAGKFDGGFEPWRNIRTRYLGDSNYASFYDDDTQTPYLEGPGGFLMGYENPRSIAEKVKYAAAKRFGGVMMWAVDLDDGRNTMIRTASSEVLCSSPGDIPSGYKCPPIQEQRWWTLLDDEKKAGMCGKTAPLYKGYYPVCDPEDPGYACCSKSGFCGSGEKFCKCKGCVDYYTSPEKILDEPIKPKGPVRWHTLDKFQAGPQCGYEGHKLENGEYAICNPDDKNAYCCSKAGYCGNTDEFCLLDGCVDFRAKPDYRYPEKTWIDEGEYRGRCGDEAPKVNGKKAECNPNSNAACCSKGGYCGNTVDHCQCDGCVDYKNPE